MTQLFAPQGPKVKQFMDIFSIPEMTLLAVANHYFISNNIEYDPVHLFKDVSVRALTDSHGIGRFFFFFGLGSLLCFPCNGKHCSIVLGFQMACILFQTSHSLDVLGSFGSFL